MRRERDIMLKELKDAKKVKFMGFNKFFWVYKKFFIFKFKKNSIIFANNLIFFFYFFSN